MVAPYAGTETASNHVPGVAGHHRVGADVRTAPASCTKHPHRLVDRRCTEHRPVSTQRVKGQVDRLVDRRGRYHVRHERVGEQLAVPVGYGQRWPDGVVRNRHSFSGQFHVLSGRPCRWCLRDNRRSSPRRCPAKKRYRLHSVPHKVRAEYRRRPTDLIQESVLERGTCVPDGAGRHADRRDESTLVVNLSVSEATVGGRRRPVWEHIPVVVLNIV